MCRLMAFVSQQSTQFSRVVGPKFAEFTQLSDFHKDGWGIAINSTDETHARISRAPEKANSSARFATDIENMQGNGALLHLRLATSGLKNCEENTHPFSFGEYSFIHNGDIRPREKIDEFIRPDLNTIRAGETDSERYFYLLVGEIERLGVAEGVHSTLEILDSHCTYSSINCMLLTPTYLLVISRFKSEKIPRDQPADYYALRYQTTKNSIVVASSGWSQNGWKVIPNNSYLLINRDELTISQENLG
jgi:predicted glutamine amidotransferase